MPPPHTNCLCGRWAWKWVSTTERNNGVLVDKWVCIACGSYVTNAYNPPSEEAQAALPDWFAGWLSEGAVADSDKPGDYDPDSDTLEPGAL